MGLPRLGKRIDKSPPFQERPVFGTDSLLMAFELLVMAEARWRRINGAHLIPLVRAGVQFGDSIQAERRVAA